MGVHGLWKLLEASGRPTDPHSLEGKVLAVDISIWLNQAVKGRRDRDGGRVHNAHLLTLFHRVCKLLYFRIRPVFVFDGDAPLLKRQTLAVRRRRREELTRESNHTHQKLVQTLLKRRAVLEALGERSTEPIPSLSTVKSDEDDIYILPPLPEPEASSSADEERSGDEMTDSHDMYQLDMDPTSVDINSEAFQLLPLEVKHQILQDMKELSKRHRTLYQPPPESSRGFSQYQLAGLLQRKHLNRRLEEVEQEMNQCSTVAGPQLHGHAHQGHTIESRRLLSEDSAHYILIKGIPKTVKAPESQSAALPWSGGPLSGARRPRADRPRPLWTTVSEEEGEEQASSSAPTPHLEEVEEVAEVGGMSPRTALAIQQAMEEVKEVEGMSPRTALAIQQAREEVKEVEGMSPRTALAIQQAREEVKEVEGMSPRTALAIQKALEEVEEVVEEVAGVVEGVEEVEKREVEEDSTPPLPQLGSNSGANRQLGKTGPAEHQNSHVPSGSSLDSSSEEEPEEAIREQANREEEAPDWLKPGEKLPEPTEKSQEQEEGRVVLKDEGLQEGSDSDDGFIQISDGEEPKQEEADDVIETWEPPPSSWARLHVQNDEDLEDLEEEEEEEEEKEKEKEEETPGPSTVPATTAWGDVDMEELGALERGLYEEQRLLAQQKEQQERTAASITGRMYLESQELLRMLGVPYLVAPGEAEAQCACLDLLDLTHGTITDDSDIWLFGGRRVYKNFFSQSKHVENYQSSDLHNQLGLDRSRLINMAYLLGSDYTEGVPGVGYVTGMEILNEFPGPGLEPLTKLSAWWASAQQRKACDPRDSKVKRKLRSLKLQAGFPDPLVAQAYLHPTVDQSQSAFSWGHPHLEQVLDFCQSRFGWTNQRTEEALQPIIKQLNSQQRQLRMDTFLCQEQQEVKEQQQEVKVGSRRLRRALTCMKRKQQQQEEEQQEVKERSRRLTCMKRKQQQEEEEKEVSLGGGGGGGFLGSEVRGGEAPPRERRGEEPGNSSSDNSSDGGMAVPMVTARSVFEGSRGGRGRGGKRGRRL